MPQTWQENTASVPQRSIRTKVNAFLFTIIYGIFRIYFCSRFILNFARYRLLFAAHGYGNPLSKGQISSGIAGLRKVPKHLSAILIIDKSAAQESRFEKLIADSTELASWCAEADIAILSLYEETGILKTNNNMKLVCEAIRDRLESHFGEQDGKVSFEIGPNTNELGAINSTRYCHRSVDNTVNTSSLSHVLTIDDENKTALVEANVPMDALLLATLKHNLVPLVVMEFPGITAGGAYSGTTGESNTFRHGFFESTVNSVEIILADGSVFMASRNENQDLFWGAASSFGTIGVVTMLEIQLRDAAESVELTYYPARTMAEATNIIERETTNPEVEYLNGIIYDKSTIVVCSGRLASLPSGVNAMQFLRPQDPWFSIYVSNLMKGTTSPVTEYIPLTDYLFRYDRGGFWVAKYAFDYFRTPFNDFTRTKHDRLLHSRVMYHELHTSGLAKENIVQDVAVPYEAAPAFHEWLDEIYGIYPLWICPLRQRRDGGVTAQHGLHADLADPAATSEFIMNFGVWGPRSKNRAEFVRQNRLLEAKAQQLCGKKWLYAHTYYAEHEFWDIYPKQEYDALRAKYKATYLPSVYDKVKVDIEAEERAIRASWKARLLWKFWNIWPLRGLYGYYRATSGGDYLLKALAPTVVI